MNQKNKELQIIINKTVDNLASKIIDKLDFQRMNEILENKYRLESERKIEEFKKKYENLYMRTRKTLREKEKECYYLEDELKVLKSTFEEYKITQNAKVFSFFLV